LIFRQWRRRVGSVIGNLLVTLFAWLIGIALVLLILILGLGLLVLVRLLLLRLSGLSGVIGSRGSRRGRTLADRSGSVIGDRCKVSILRRVHLIGVVLAATRGQKSQQQCR
jgi:hypothetical protein